MDGLTPYDFVRYVWGIVSTKRRRKRRYVVGVHKVILLTLTLKREVETKYCMKLETKKTAEQLILNSCR